VLGFLIGLVFSVVLALLFLELCPARSDAKEICNQPWVCFSGTLLVVAFSNRTITYPDKADFSTISSFRGSPAEKPLLPSPESNNS
jgi:hypothetical protein